MMGNAAGTKPGNSGTDMITRIRNIICAALLLMPGIPGHSQDIQRQKEKKERLEQEIAILDAQIAANASKSSSMLSDLELIRKNVANRKALVAESDRQIRDYSDRIYRQQLNINRMQARVDTLTGHYSRLVRSAYKNRDTRVWYMYMLASNDLTQAYRRFGYFKNLSSEMKNEARKLRSLKAELEQEKEKLSGLKKEAEGVRAERVRELDKLRKDEARADEVVKQLKKDRKKYENQLTAKKKEVNALNREIQRLIAEAVKGKNKKPDTGQDNSADITLSAEFVKNKGKLPWPVRGPVVARFGKHFHPVFKNLELPANNGIDIAVSPGTGINSVFNGTVKQVFVMPGYNKCVLVQHGKNYFTFYCKLSRVDVKEGDKIVTGQTLGVVDTILGQTQVHFELWKDTAPQNPELWLR